MDIDRIKMIQKRYFSSRNIIPCTSDNDHRWTDFYLSMKRFIEEIREEQNEIN